MVLRRTGQAWRSATGCYGRGLLCAFAGLDHFLVAWRASLSCLIEDSPTEALHLQAVLEQEGFEVLRASDGRKGLVAAREQHPDVIVLDVEMPEMDGFQVCQQLKSDPETDSIPVQS